MITTRQSAQLCADLYDDSKPPASWDHYWKGDDVVVAHRIIDSQDTITFRGSKPLIDWMRDAAAAVPYFDHEIGWVPLGFHIGMDDALSEVLAAVKGPLYINGHSLGGARARQAAGKLLVRGIKVAGLCVFGSPKAGMSNLTRIFDKTGLVRQSWRNLDDPVPLTPATLPPLMEWEHTEQYGAFSEHAAPDDLEPFRNHHCQLYVAGAEKLIPSTSQPAPS